MVRRARLDESGQVTAVSFQRNRRALDFYAAHAFRIVKTTDGSANEEHEPDVLLAWAEPH